MIENVVKKFVWGSKQKGVGEIPRNQPVYNPMEVVTQFMKMLTV